MIGFRRFISLRVMERTGESVHSGERGRGCNKPVAATIVAQVQVSHDNVHNVLRARRPRTEREMADFVDHLPPRIEGSQKVYTAVEVAALISAVLSGATPTDRLTSSLDIRDIVEQYMQDRIEAAAAKFPGVLTEKVNWYNQKPITNFQERFVFANQWLSLSQLSPATLQKLNTGYRDLAPDDRGHFLRELAEIHEGRMSNRGQDHLYFENPDLAQTMAQVKARAESIKTNLNVVADFAGEYREALQRGDYRQAHLVQHHAMRYLDQNIQNLGTEYKVHLHSTPFFTPQIIDRLFMALRFDPDLRNNISALKVARTSNSQANASLPAAQREIVADIVIYPRRGRSIEESAEVVNLLVSRLQKHLMDYDTPPADAQELPRYNQRVSHLLFLAQSGGDLKNNLRDLGLLDRYFDRRKEFSVLVPGLSGVL